MPELGLLATLTIALAVALVFGLLSQRVGLSPIVGYLLAGVCIGPYTPGIVADQKTAAQMSEIGVILLMFGVGLQFHLKDLWAVRRMALPGALLQSATATAVGCAVTLALGWPLAAGMVTGVAISVSSTVVMSRVLTDNGLLETPQGHVAVGWTIVEDLVTVVVLVLLPCFAATGKDEANGFAMALVLTLVKLAVLAGIMGLVGMRLVPQLLLLVARTRSRELFTLVVLVTALGIATTSFYLFGTSLALGAFLAGVAVGQSRVSHQAAADALPMRDAFAVLFFVAMGMLFDPRLMVQQPGLTLALLGAILLIKPVTAFCYARMLGGDLGTALTVGLCVTQIGEFSFILAEVARRFGFIDLAGHSALVASALISISLNPLMVRGIRPVEQYARKRPWLWRLLNGRSNERAVAPGAVAQDEILPVNAIVVGYGPVGRVVTRILRDFGIQPTVIELNVDTVAGLSTADHPVIYGDATRREILRAAGVEKASYLIVTIPDLTGRMPVVATARMMNPELVIVTRARYLKERAMLEEMGATLVRYEEAEAAVALAETLLERIGARPEAIRDEVTRVRAEVSAM